MAYGAVVLTQALAEYGTLLGGSLRGLGRSVSSAVDPGQAVVVGAAVVVLYSLWRMTTRPR